MFGPRRCYTRRNLMSFFLFMKMSLPAATVPHAAFFTFSCLPAATVPDAGVPQRTSAVQLLYTCRPGAYRDETFSARTLRFVIQRIRRNVKPVCGRLHVTGIPAVLCIAKPCRCLYPTRTKCLIAGANHDNSTTRYSVVPGGRRQGLARALAK